MNTLITGATGFIGRHLLTELLKIRDKKNLFCLVREKSPGLKLLENTGVNIIKSDLDDKTTLYSIFKNLDLQIVYHLAASARINRPANEYLVNNITGTENLMDCLQPNAKKIVKIVYISSLHARSDHKSSYSESKRKAEEAIIKFCKKTGVAYCILRPPIVYGPMNKTDAGLMKFVASIKKNGLISRLNFPGACSLIYMLDLVKFCLLAEKTIMANNKIFYIYSDQRVGLEEIMKKISSILDIPRNRIKLPNFCYRLADNILPFLSICSSFGANLSDTLGLLLNNSWVCDISEAEELLGFKPDYKIDRGLKETLDWLQQT